MGSSQSPRKNGYLAGTSIGRRSSILHLFPPADASQEGSDDNKMECQIKDEHSGGYTCYPYKLSRLKYIALIILYLCTAGLLWLIFYWRPDWKLKFTHFHTTFLKKFDSVYLRSRDGTNRVFVAEVKESKSEIKKIAPYLFQKTDETKPGSFHERGDGIHHNIHVTITNSPTDDSSRSLDDDSLMYFFHAYMKFVWNEDQGTFVKVDGLDTHTTVKNVHQAAAENGLSINEQTDLRTVYGENVIHVEVPSHLKLLLSEVLNPFYVFQLFACIFWMVDEYVAYATSIIIISMISAIVSLITVRRERQKLHNMVEYHNRGSITVMRGKVVKQNSVTQSAAVPKTEYATEKIWTKDLVPGDVIVIPPSGIRLSFDAALITGTCIVNESMLTGESIPVTKTPLPSGDTEMNQTYSVKSQTAHTLFCGTEIIQTRYYKDELVRAVVVRTGFNTAKGLLVHSILFPKPVDLKLMRDAYRFVGIMFLISLLGFAYSTILHIQNQDDVKEILFRSIDMITITVPPALPLAMTIGIIYAQKRLKKSNIHTVSPQRINICGQVDVVAFDKTGTLTEDGLDLTEVIPVHLDKFSLPISPSDISQFGLDSEIIRCMTTCHSLTLIDNELVGDPLDIKMLQATGWELIEPKVEDEAKYDQLQMTYVRPPKNMPEDISLSTEIVQNEYQGFPAAASYSSQAEHEIGIVRQFPFISELKRACVIVKPLKSSQRDMMVYVKGAPETIAGLCVSVPFDFTNVLTHYTKQGHRVIALSYKPIRITWVKAQKIERSTLEQDLQFLGLLILQNKLKADSSNVIQDLDNAKVRSLMVTGDNLETAICVAFNCRILKPDVPVLIAKTAYHVASPNCTPILTWHLAEDFNQTGEDGRKRLSPHSSSEECDTISTVLNMGDSLSPQPCQLALTGKDFAIIRQYFPQFLPALAVQGAVFARMSPQQKTELMEELDGVDYHVLMCGDGANDCGALKRAHVGLSLSEFDASVAAPFTSRTENGIGSVITLMREGRAALVTSFGMFKFMALYSLIQFTTVLLLYRKNSNLADYMFLYIDLIIIDVVALTMSLNHAHKTLDWRKPSYSLVSAEMLVSLFIQIFLQFGVQILAYMLVQEQCWYQESIFVDKLVEDEHNNETQTVPTTTVDYSGCPPLASVTTSVFPEDDYSRTYETTTLFFLSSFMYMWVSITFARGKPFRTPIYRNTWFVGCIVLLIGFTLFMMFGAPPGMEDFIEIRHIPDPKFLLILLGIIVGHLLVSLTLEMLVEQPTLWRYLHKICQCCHKRSSKRYKYIMGFLSGLHSVEGEIPTVPAVKLDANSKKEMIIKREIFIPSTLIGQPIEGKIDMEYTEGRMDHTKYKTKL